MWSNRDLNPNRDWDLPIVVQNRTPGDQSTGFYLADILRATQSSASQHWLKHKVLTLTTVSPHPFFIHYRTGLLKEQTLLFNADMHNRVWWNKKERSYRLVVKWRRACIDKPSPTWTQTPVMSNPCWQHSLYRHMIHSMWHIYWII